MRKLLIGLMLCLSGVIYGQNDYKPSRVANDEKDLLRMVIDGTAEVMRIRNVPYSNARTDSLFYSVVITSDTTFSEPDSLGNVDTTVVVDTVITDRLSVGFNFLKLTKYNRIKLYNAGANADTVKFENYGELAEEFINSVALIDDSTNAIVTDPTLIILDPGQEKSYMIKEEYTGRVQVSSPVTTGQEGDLVVIKFIGIDQ